MSLIEWSDTGIPYIVLPKGFSLTPFRQTDATAWVRLRNDPDVLKWSLFEPHPISIAEAQLHISAQMAISDNAIHSIKAGGRTNRSPFAAIRDANDELIGSCSLSDPFRPSPSIGQDYRSYYNHPKIGWSIISSQRGQGLATNAAKAMVDYCTQYMEDNVISGGCDATNVRSAAIFNRLGFELVHVHREILPSGQVFSGNWYTLQLRG